jgi:hypothetical protein
MLSGSLVTMAWPQVADTGDGLQIWKVAANILNKQSRTDDREWPSSMGVLTNPTIKVCICCKLFTQCLGNGWILCGGMGPEWILGSLDGRGCRVDPVGSG